MKPPRMHMPYSCTTAPVPVPVSYSAEPLGPQPPLCALLSLQASGIDYRLGWRHGLEMMGEAAG